MVFGLVNVLVAGVGAGNASVTGGRRRERHFLAFARLPCDAGWENNTVQGCISLSISCGCVRTVQATC